MLEIVLLVAAFLLSLSVHEMAHAYMADRLGDPTARLMGRVTLNPLAHLDPLGTLLPIFFLLVRSPVVFGWGKPVQMDPYNLRHPRRDSAIISVSGPAANMLLAILLSIVVRLTSLDLFLVPVIVLNVTWALFNLTPIHPLDGGKVLTGILPLSIARDVDDFLNRYGMFILLFLIFPIFGGTAPLFNILLPIVRIILSILIPGTSLI